MTSLAKTEPGRQPIRRATISADNMYRYRLTRWWNNRPPMYFVMLNPSTADDQIDDPTIRRCMGFAQREKCGGIVVTNLYALRATNPDELKRADDPYGPKNGEALDAAIGEAEMYGTPLVCAWGTRGGRGAEKFLLSAKAAGAHLNALGVTKNEHPKHPLYLRSDSPLVTFRDYRNAEVAP